MRRGIQIALAPVLVLAGATQACLWDRDTLKQEARGMPDVIRVITGRFERNPPAYYELRLARIEAAVEAATDAEEKLSLCDDAGVACDRLHRSPEALAWMKRKKSLLDQMPDLAEAKTNHLYRYHANLGTFIVHEWLRDGAMDGQIDKLREARKHIRKAIEINPQAHFDREKYQLMAMDWIYARMNRETLGQTFLTFPEDLNYDERREAAKKAADGIMGLIVLGDAWESIDVYRSLATALGVNDHASIHYLANLRIAELQDAGKTSLASGKKIDPEKNAFSLLPKQRDAAKKFFQEARKEAEQWQQQRTAYLTSQFSLGKHPDTHPDFWEDFKDASQPPDLP